MLVPMIEKAVECLPKIECLEACSNGIIFFMHNLSDLMIGFSYVMMSVLAISLLPYMPTKKIKHLLYIIIVYIWLSGLTHVLDVSEMFSTYTLRASSWIDLFAATYSAVIVVLVALNRNHFKEIYDTLRQTNNNIAKYTKIVREEETK